MVLVLEIEVWDGPSSLKGERSGPSLKLELERLRLGTSLAPGVPILLSPGLLADLGKESY